MSSLHADATVDSVTRRALLLVEDYEDLACTMQMYLESQGFSVKVAASIAEALQVYEHDQISLVLSDLTLPDGSGLDLLGQLRSRGCVRAIALSGYDSRDCVRRCLQAGFDEYLAKPFEEHQLMDAVQRVLGPSEADWDR